MNLSPKFLSAQFLPLFKYHCRSPGGLNAYGPREHFAKQLLHSLDIVVLLWATNKPPVG